MHMMNFTAEETNLIAIYKTDTLAGTLAAIDEAMPYMYDEDIITMSESTSRKLKSLTEQDFSALSFELDGYMDEW